ncbi:unnamed protein product [Lactuca saligna]|uniref:MULE transposase domain-containing protein n=1 Tax=Lactuca saligna TaxID=75948 RepID=A0AA36E056_LACSI|nr:unnamed protein product [Lactuca saligna]
MASSSGTKKVKGPEKVYVRDEDSDDDLIDFSFLDFAPETFKPTSNLSDDPFLNMLCDENMLRRTLDGMGDDDHEVGVKDPEHDHIDDQNDGEVGVEYRVHDPDIHWKQMKPVVGECYESPAQLRNFNFGTLVSCNWLAKHYLKDIVMKPKMTLTEMKEDVLRMFSVNVSKGQCHRARTKAREMIEGKLEEHYAKVWDYAAEILRSNPGSTCKVGVDSNASGMNYFKRFYVCLKAFKDGWNRGCRRVIGLDGCFLKGQIKGELLTAIGRDADNHVYPIAWAVIDVENKDNWTWFIELLVADLDLDCGRGLVVISDQHKGLLQAVTELLPYVEHRQCARHIYANFRKKYTGPKGDGGGNLVVNIAKTPRKVDKGKKKVVEDTSKEVNEGHNKVVDHTSKEASEGKMKAVEGTSKEAGKMIDVDQSISPLKRMKMMERRGGKIKYVGRIGVVHGSISQNVAGVDHEDFETIKDLQASGYDHGEIVEAFNKLTKERKEMLAESIVDEETSQETQDPLVKKRKPSERIIKIKLKKAVHDPDGGGSTIEKALTLD